VQQLSLAKNMGTKCGWSALATIGSFRIVNETSSAAGVRRIEVVTGRVADQLITDRFDVLNQASAILSSKPDDVATAAQQLHAQNQQLQKELNQLRQKMAQQEATSLVDEAQEVAGVKVRYHAPDDRLFPG